MPTGFFGKILLIDLNANKIDTINPPEKTYRKYLGGIGLGVHLLYKLQPAGIDPLGKENHLGFFPGFFTGTSVPFSGRFMVVGKSPLTLGWGDANGGGQFGPELRRAGWDGLIIRGSAEEPIKIVIRDDDVEIQSAREIWGLGISDTESKLKKELGDNKFQVAAIGPAGEKKSLISGIVNDGGRIAARSGLGAVMGSKKIKAIAVRGKKRIPLADEKKYRKIRQKYFKKTPVGKKEIEMRDPKVRFWLLRKFLPVLRLLKIEPKGATDALYVYTYKKWGTSFYTPVAIFLGNAPIKNFKGNLKDFPLPKQQKLDGDRVISFETRKYACRSCPIACGGEIHLESKEFPEYSVEKEHRPEYETLSLFGSNILNDNLDSIFKINQLCNQAGLDTISTATVVAFAMECWEQGLISKKDTNGIELEWGNHRATVELVKMIIERKELGDVLADGVFLAAQKIGNGAEAFAMHVGGQEIPAHDPRVEKTLALSYELDATPGRHNKGNVFFAKASKIHKVIPSYIKKQGKKHGLYRAHNYFLQFFNSCGICEFGPWMGIMPLKEYITAFTGWNDFTMEELFLIGERIHTLRHLFTLREGINPLRYWKLPERIRSHLPQLDQWKIEYLQECDWDVETTIPSENCAKRLELEQELKECLKYTRDVEA